MSIRSSLVVGLLLIILGNSLRLSHDGNNYWYTFEESDDNRCSPGYDN